MWPFIFYYRQRQDKKDPQEKKSKKGTQKADGVVKSKKTHANSEAVRATRHAKWVQQAARVHLAEKYVNNSAWRAVHFKGSALKGAPKCKAEGWQQVIIKLILGNMPHECDLCMALLKEKNFNMDDFKRDIDPSTTTLFQDQNGAQVAESPPARAPGAADAAVSPQSQSPGGVDVVGLAKKDKYLQLLPPGSRKKRLPVKCLVCQRSSTKQLAVFDLISRRNPKWLNQHLDGPTHKGNVRRMEAKNKAMVDATSGDSTVLRPCQGLSVCQAEGSKLHECFEVLKLWLAYNSAHAIASAKDDREATGHKYQQDPVMKDVIINHARCNRESIPVGPDQRAVCDKCLQLQSDRSILRTTGRLYLKHTAASSLDHLVEILWSQLLGKVCRDD